MNENDKILISSYLDNELSEDEKKYVESLLESSNDAVDYLNALKSSSNEIDMFFNSDEIKDLTNNIDRFINKNKSNSTFSFSKVNFFNYSKYFGGAIALTLLTVIMFPIFIQEDIKTINNINIERNANLYDANGALNIPIIIQDSINQMIEQDFTQANVLIGNEIILIKINNIKNDNCVYGAFQFENITKEFKSCLIENKYDIQIK